MKFHLDLEVQGLPTIRVRDQGYIVPMSDDDAQQLVDWLNTIVGLEHDALVEALSEMTSWIADGWPLDEWADDHPLTAPSTAGELRRVLAALALTKGE